MSSKDYCPHISALDMNNFDKMSLENDADKVSYGESLSLPNDMDWDQQNTSDNSDQIQIDNSIKKQL